jgi:NADH-quinone oxidoreductase subunit N
MSHEILREITTLVPILLPALGGVWVLIFVAIAGDRDVVSPAAHSVVVLGLSMATAVILLGHGTRAEVLDGALLVDGQALVFSLVFAVVAILTIVSSAQHLQAPEARHAEYYALILFATSGMGLMAATESLLTLFLGLEILSIPLYVLAGFTRDRAYAVEGALKYFLLGAFSTGFVLYGIALFYGATGSIDLRGVASHLDASAGRPGDPLLLVGAGLLLVGLAFKIAAVPFHFWAPDVYQGSMAPVAGFMAAGTKAAAFAALLRVLNVGLGDPAIREEWIPLVQALAILTMVVGNIVALAQQNIKRMLAYSSIANAGYLLVGVAAGSRTGDGTPVVLFYLAVYAFMTVGAFAVAAVVGRGGQEDEGYALSAYAGLARRRPRLAFAMAVFMLSLTGIPPAGGFMAKFYLFRAAVDAGMYALAAVGVVAAVVGAFYYLRVVVQMYLREPGLEPLPLAVGAPEGLAIALAAAAVLYLGLFPSGLFALAQSLV